MSIIFIPLSFATGCLLTLFAVKTYGDHLAKQVNQLDENSNRLIELKISFPGAQGLALSINALVRNYRLSFRKKERENDDLMRGLSELSHDIKTPLAGAKGHIQLTLPREESDGRVSETRETTAHLKSAIARIDAANSILDSLTNYTRACDPDRELELQSVRILPALLNVLDGYEPLFLSKKWIPTLVIEDENVEAKANEQALRRIFDNLISNALRYGKSAPKLTLTHSEFILSNKVENPASIDPKLIFERFYKSNGSRTTAGSGLGLPTARKLAAKIGMSLNAKIESDSIIFSLRF